MTDSVAMAAEIFAVWGAGGFNDANGLDNCRKFFTDDVNFDFDGNFKNTTGYKVYNGHQGVLDWCNWVAENIELKDFVPSFFAGPDPNTVMVKLSARHFCKSTGKSTPPVVDMEQFTFVGGKCSKCQIFWGNAAAVDATFAPDPLALTQAVFATWGAGGFNDANGLDNCRKFFTDDVVFDFDGNFKNTTGYKVYNGHQGVLDWCSWFAANVDLKDFVPSFFPGPDSNTAMVRLSAIYTCKSTGKSTPPVVDMEQFTFVGGKCSKCQLFFGDAAAEDATFAA